MMMKSRWMRLECSTHKGNEKCLWEPQRRFKHWCKDNTKTDICDDVNCIRIGSNGGILYGVEISSVCVITIS
jgi:hypothetical protein